MRNGLRTSCTVCQVSWDDKTSLSSNPHPAHAFVPTFDHPSGTKVELKRLLPAVSERVKDQYIYIKKSEWGDGGDQRFVRLLGK